MQLNDASEKKLAGVKPELVEVVQRAAELSAQPFQIVQGNRTQAQQDALYAQGRTKPGQIVTWTRRSKHIGGNAVDFAALVNGTLNWREELYPPIAKAFKQAAGELGVGIEWGGDWHTKDWGHIQLSNMAVPMTTARYTAPVTQGSPQSRPQQAMGLFITYGWQACQAAAMAAQGMWESGGNHTDNIITDAVGDHGHAHGGWQWQGTRFAELQKIAQAKGKPWTDLETQCAFVDWELKTSERGAGKLLAAAPDVETATRVFMEHYLRPANASSYAMRLALARTLLLTNDHPSAATAA